MSVLYLKAAVDEGISAVYLEAAVDEGISRVVGLHHPEGSAYEGVEVLVKHDVPLGVTKQRIASRQHR